MKQIVCDCEGNFGSRLHAVGILAGVRHFTELRKRMESVCIEDEFGVARFKELSNQRKGLWRLPQPGTDQEGICLWQLGDIRGRFTDAQDGFRHPVGSGCCADRRDGECHETSPALQRAEC